MPETSMALVRSCIFKHNLNNNEISKREEEEEENERETCNKGCSLVFFSLVFTLSLRKDVIIG